MTGISEALILTFFMGAVIFFCRAFPFIFFSGNRKKFPGVDCSAGKKNLFQKNLFLDFVEKVVPPVAMTVLAFNSLGIAVKNSLFNSANWSEGFSAIAAAAVTALLHLWKSNPLLSIIGGTALYMILIEIQFL